MPYKDRGKQREYQREWYKKRREDLCHRVKERREALIAKGLCRDCTKPVSGYTRCPVCSSKSYQKHIGEIRRYREKWLEEGRCLRCGAPLHGDEGSNYCFPCQCSRHLTGIPRKKGVWRSYETLNQTVTR